MKTVGVVVPTPTSMDEVRQQTGPNFPILALPQGGTALAMFCANFWGQNDVIHLADAGMHCTLVDINEERLDEMRDIYPDDWEYHTADAWEFANDAGDRRWDVVTVDPWTAQMDAALESIDLWCSLANKAVIIGNRLVDYGVIPPYLPTIPEGWDSTVLQRNGRVGWLVVTR